jgi:hypothetical protein
MRAPLTALSLGAAAMFFGAAPTYAAGNDPGIDAWPSDYDSIVFHGERTLPGDESGGVTPADDGPVMERYTSFDDYLCRSPTEVFVEHYHRPAGSDEPWELVSSGCELPGIRSPGVQPGRPVLTPDDVREAVRRIGLPASTLEVPVETFVNYDTTVYTSPVTFARTVTLLGYTVDVRAEPSSYQWIFGDGTSQQTATPGRPYPADDITHIWTDAHRAFHPRVHTTYSVRYRVDGGPWLEVGDTLTVPGPSAAVRIREATGMLAEMD